MKKIISITICIMIATFLIGCGETEKTSETKKHVDYTYLYKDILNQYKKSCETNEEVNRDNKNYLSTGLVEMADADEKDLPHKVGYRLQDLNGDGVDELLISLIEKTGYYDYIIAIYQHIDGEGVNKVEDGWARNKYYLLKNNKLLNEASGGAAYSYISKLKMVGNHLKTESMLATDLDGGENEDDEYEEVYLYNKVGKTTKKKEFYVSKIKWEKKYAEWIAEKIEVDFIPFADYK